MYIVGIDPGAKGAIAIIPAYSFREARAYPFTHNSPADILYFLSEMRGGEACTRARNISTPTLKNGCRSTAPITKPPEDNGMEIWLEAPGQIVLPPSRGKSKTASLLAGMSSSRKLGRSVGFWEGIATALNISPEMVPPKRWQKHLNCQTKGDKNISKKAAIKAFPYLTKKDGTSKITHDVADALLIALYGYVQSANPKYVPSQVKELING